MLTKYDEYPVHQSAHPFSRIPSTDLSWDEGYYFGGFNADHQVFLLTGLRVNPNADMVGGYAVINIAGRQYSVRLSRCWRQQIDTVIGPLSIEFVEPLKTIRLRLDANDSALSFDLTWSGIAPATLEAHHYAETRGRVTTDQTLLATRRGHRLYPVRTAPLRSHTAGLGSQPRPFLGAICRPQAARRLRPVATAARRSRGTSGDATSASQRANPTGRRLPLHGHGGRGAGQPSG